MQEFSDTNFNPTNNLKSKNIKSEYPEIKMHRLNGFDLYKFYI